MDFLWIICIFLLAANQNCNCSTDSRGINSECGCGKGVGSCCGTGMESGRGTGSCCGSGPDTGCGCTETVNPGRSFYTGNDVDCDCCAADIDPVPNDCSCEVPQPLMPGPSGEFRTAQYPFPPYPVLRE